MEDELWANSSAEIADVLEQRADLRDRMMVLAANEPMYHLGTEAPEEFRDIVRGLITGNDPPESAANAAAECLGGAPEECNETLNLQFIRFYNQAVLEMLMERGVTRVCVPRVRTEVSSSQCSRELAGKGHSIVMLHRRLLVAYGLGKGQNGEAVIPQHPFCRHVVRPMK